MSTSADQRKMLQPKEAQQIYLMVEQVVNVLKESSLNPFLNDLDKNQLYNIASGKTVSTEIKSSSITIDKKGQQMMLEYMERINKDNVTDSVMMDVILKIV